MDENETSEQRNRCENDTEADQSPEDSEQASNEQITGIALLTCLQPADIG
jgi:hypothetical protein